MIGFAGKNKVDTCITPVFYTTQKGGFSSTFPLTDSRMQSAMLQPITIAIPQIT
jgi:hypothetical protein